MADYVNLIGAEDVRAAGNTMRSAADTMGSAVGSFTWALEQHQRFMDDWLQRFAAVLEANQGAVR
jgi:hypothetical protein